MNINIVNKINDLRSRLDEADMYLGPAANERDIQNLIVSSGAELAERLPDQYIEFLRSFDGLVSGGVFIYSSRPHKFVDSAAASRAFVDVNLMARDLDFMKDFLIFGDSDQDEYVLELSSQKFQVRDKQAIDNVFEEFVSFDELLEFMLDLVIQNS